MKTEMVMAGFDCSACFKVLRAGLPELSNSMNCQHQFYSNFY